MPIFLHGYILHIRNSLSCVKAAEVNGIRRIFTLIWIVSILQLWSRLSLLCQRECCRNQKEKIAEAVKQAPKRVVRQVRILQHMMISDDDDDDDDPFL